MHHIRKSQLAAAISLIVWITPTSGADTPAAGAEQPATQLPRVEVTGSHIKRIDIETSSPVQVLSREDIQRTGATTLRALIEALPSSNPSLSDLAGGFLASFSAGGSSASLRNLGKQSTLVLLNSRRVAPFALADFNQVFVNIDALPMDAIERVEILKSGASAIYGSDAVAGVINIITRSDFNGVVVGGETQKSLLSKRFGESRAYLAGGVGKLDSDRYNILANIEVYSRDKVVVRDVLKYANPLALSRIPSGMDQLSPFSHPGNVFTSDPPGAGPVPGCDPAMLIGGLCLYDDYAHIEAQPRADRVSALVSARVKLGGNTEAFGEWLLSRTKTSYVFPYSSYSMLFGDVTWPDPATGALNAFHYRGLPVGHPLNPSAAEAVLSYRFTDSPSERIVTSDNLRLIAGLRGTAGKWEWQSALSLLSSKVDDASRGSFSASGFKQVIGDAGSSIYDLAPVPLEPDFFNKPGGYLIGQPNSQGVVDTLFPRFGYKAETRQVGVDGKVTGELASLPAGLLDLATGFELRRESMRIVPSDNLGAGDVVGSGVVRTDAARSFGALFAELNVPVTEKFEGQVAARVDKFPGFGAHVSPKLGLRFQPTKQLMLRGTLEGGFRAPNLTESGTSTRSSAQSGIADPQRCPQAAALADDLRAQAAALPDTDPTKPFLTGRASLIEFAECSGLVTNITRHNPGLKPEVSRGASLGLVFEPTADTHFSFDFWSIHRKDEIGLRNTNELLATEGALPAGVSVGRNPLAADQSFTPAEQAAYGVTVGDLSGINDQFANVSRTRTAGFDVEAKGRFRSSLGQVQVGFAATYLQSYVAYSSVIQAYGNNLAGTYGFPRLKAMLTAQLTRGNFVNGIGIYHTGSTSLRGDYYDSSWTVDGCAARSISAGDCRVGTTSRLDYFFSYTGVKNLTFSAYLRNVLNQYPAFDARSLADVGGNFLPTQPEDAQRRTLKLSVEYKF